MAGQGGVAATVKPVTSYAKAGSAINVEPAFGWGEEFAVRS
jgi:hypothetical protein